MTTSTAIDFLSVSQIGGTPDIADSTGLVFTFDTDPTTLSVNDITITGATKGTLIGSGTTRNLAISDITAANGGIVSVIITKPEGYSINGSPQTAVVYRAPYIGMAYQGGIIAYILQSGDPGYISGATHGFIASVDDLSNGIKWNNGSFITTGATGTALGTGLSNTTTIISIQGAGSYAAKLCSDYTNPDTGTGVYSDWYLPSKDELNKLFLNKISIERFFVQGSYWSSSESSSGHAWYQYFYDGNCFSPQTNTIVRVRAVRSF